MLEAETEAYRGPAGEVAAWNENILAAIPGTSARVPEAECVKRKDDGIRLDVAIDAHNVIHAGFRFRRA
ncbi:hypothetical protein [Poseidonocella sp. HB161398]|uniref:hypothetical protein n=1 Tax=Poseidonocella sp. HB161398 TaxID=2320855 RepID=UPI001486F556|nr:hypothetical protein [Poseidonocella sp. HB161398]